MGFMFYRPSLMLYSIYRHLYSDSYRCSSRNVIETTNKTHTTGVCLPVVSKSNFMKWCRRSMRKLDLKAHILVSDGRNTMMPLPFTIFQYNLYCFINQYRTQYIYIYIYIYICVCTTVCVCTRLCTTDN